jgi:palmitoyltransferase ZDHHC13/17
LREAACSGNLQDIVRLHQQYGHSIINEADRNGWTALLFAAYHGNLEMVQYLVETCRADINAVDTNGYTPLHNAARSKYGRVPLVQYLVEQCGCVDVQQAVTKSGDTPLHSACTLDNVKIVEYLAESASCATILIRNASGQTPLHIACDKRASCGPLSTWYLSFRPSRVQMTETS